MTWFTDQSQTVLDDSHCPKNWTQFLHLCYYLSNYMSTIGQANQTCSFFHLNESRLMHVKNPLQVLYAAHVMKKNNLNRILLEIDPNLMKDGKIVQMLSFNDSFQWEEFQGKFLHENLNNNNIKRQAQEESTTMTANLINIADTLDACHQFKSNVVNKDSNVLILSIESDSNQYICSLSNADSSLAYSHLCQYVLDRCENNIACGKYGRCINNETSFFCICSFFHTGSFCDEYSHKDIQIILAIIAIIISVFAVYSRPRELVAEAIQWFLHHPQPIPTPSPSPQPINDDYNGTEPRVQWPSIDAPPQSQQYEFRLESNEQYLRAFCLLILSIVFFVLFFKCPTIDHVQSSQLNQTDSLNNRDQTIEYHRRYVISIENFVYLVVSGLLIVTFSLLLKLEKRNPDEDDDRSGMTTLCFLLHYTSAGISGLVEPIKLLRINDRVETTAIIVIQMFEILEILEETMTDIDESAQYGVFPQIFKRIFFIILIAFRYYPTLASLQFQNIFVRVLIFVYFIGSMIYRTLFDGSSTHGLLFLIKYLRSKDAYSWSFMYGSMKNLVHYSFTGYVCAELLMRLLYDSTYICLNRGKMIWETPHRTIEQYSYKADRGRKRFIRKSKKKNRTNVGADQNGCLNRIRRYLNSIYQSNETFRYTTIAVCTYTVAYLFLFHLTGTIILLYNERTNVYMQYIEKIFKDMLNIGSLQTEVIISAMITTTIYSIQLFLSIKNFRQNIDRLYDEYSTNHELGKKLKNREIIRKSTQYPSYLLLYLLGGYFLCFHLILFICLIIERLIFIPDKSSKVQPRIIYVLPILVFYFLQKIIIRLLYKMFDYLDKRDFGDTNSNQSANNFPEIKLSILDSILLYLKLISCAFIGIIASIIRLLISVLVNIVFMPRIDYSYLIEPLRSTDSAHESFRAFVRLEILIVNPLLLEYSRVGQVTITPNAPIPPREEEAVPPSQEPSTSGGVDEDIVSRVSAGEAADDHQQSGDDAVFDDERAVLEPFLVQQHQSIDNNFNQTP